MKRAVLYARYSSDNQREASIEDQLRLCRELADREGWDVRESYSDYGVSGASMMRPGIRALLADALAGDIDVVIAEALDRLSRDQADIADVYRRLKFAGVGIVTVAEGEINELHVGLKGTMNALFLKDLAQKTRRGLRGRVEAGKSGGGNSYGYDVVHQLEHGSLVRGERTINPAQAAIVRRIFAAYAEGHSPRAIAKSLNADGIPGPAGRGWGPSTIHGNRSRGTGILNNELYVGRMVWNRLRYIKDPTTGKRISRPNPVEEWVITEVAELALIDHDVWDRVKARQRAVEAKSEHAQHQPFKQRRSKTLFSGKMRCGVCGGGAVVWNEIRIGCANARNKGTCTNKTTIRRDVLENHILHSLQHRLMDPALLEVFCQEFTRELNRLRAERNAGLENSKAELKRVKADLDRLIQAILDGVPGSQVKDRIAALETRKSVLEASLTQAEPEKVLLHPGMATLYREKVTELRDALDDPNRLCEAKEIIRDLVDVIELTPVTTADGRSELTIDLHGDLPNILALSQNDKDAAITGDVLDKCTKLVAGRGFEPLTFRL